MDKYINAEKLIAEIERHIKEVKEAENRFHPNLGFFDAKLSGIYDTLSIIDSLQQEQPEVDLDENTMKEEFRMIDNACLLFNYDKLSREQLIARRFYQLGLNARKEE